MALALAGCGSLDTEAAEEEIAQGIRARTGERDVRVECPEKVELKTGGIFHCRASGAVEGRVRVIQTSDEGDIRWELRQEGRRVVPRR